MGTTLSLCCCGGCCKYGILYEPVDDNMELENASDLNVLIEDSKTWKTGDVILEAYHGVRETQIISDSPWTHVGIIYKDQHNDNQILLLEMVFDGVKNEEIGQRAKLFLNSNENHYIGYRKLNQELTVQQLDKFNQGFEILKNKKFENDLTSVIGAVCDCGDCFGFCGCCVTICNDKKDKKRLETLFCSELCAEILQRCGIMKTNVESDEYAPADFDKGRLNQYINQPFQYGDIVYYHGI